MSKIKRLTVVEITDKEDTVIPAGTPVTVFKDEKTGKLYRPTTDFTVTGDDLGKFFKEIKD